MTALLREPRACLIVVAGLTLLRFLAGAVLPLSADEAYYWLWSKHLAAGYYDHPPAIAFLIRAGTAIFGDTPLGVRAVPMLLSVPASWFVWRAGAAMLGGEREGAIACVLFNLTLMIAVEAMAATPDAPLIACSAAFLFALAKTDKTGDGRWWLAAGFAGGLALLSKYTAFFLGTGAAAWIVFTPSGRRWLVSPWPYLGAALALAVFVPNLIWNAGHGYETFAFQFGRIGAGHFTLRYLAELVGAQILLATPAIFACTILGFARWRNGHGLLAAFVLPAVAYFVIHALHDRVQGNWPCFLYPAAAIGAARFILRDNSRWGAWLSMAAVPVAAAMLAVCYAQVFFDVVPMGRVDPSSRILAYGMPEMTEGIARQRPPPKALLTTDYETTAWLAFYSRLPVVQLNEEDRWPTAARAGPDILSGRNLYIAPQKKDLHDLVGRKFATIVARPPIPRFRGGKAVAEYNVYEVRTLRGGPLGRMP